MRNETTKEVLKLIEKSPTAFHAIDNLKERLENSGFTELKETETWSLQPGSRHYVIRNHSSILSFILPEESITAFRLIATHSDSPCFKLKPYPEINDIAGYVKLNVERYGGMILSSWFDRPLSVAGRIIVNQHDRFQEKLVNIDQDLLIIPSLAIHMNPQTNKGIEYNPQKELLPLLTQAVNEQNEDNDTKSITDIISERTNTNPSDILGSDLFLYNRMPPAFWGTNDEFIASPRLDDLECCFTTFLGFLDAAKSELQKSIVDVHVVFDNEEVGSGTAQGADSTFLSEILERISLSCGFSREEFMAQISSSFMLSADNAHAMHPNYIEKADPVNQPVLNKGIVIKHNANQKYTTDGISTAMIVKLCQAHGIPYQYFTNRSDMTGGSTLGNISQSHLSMKTADIGLSQFSMHSSYESAGAHDPAYMRKLSEMFYLDNQVTIV